MSFLDYLLKNHNLTGKKSPQTQTKLNKIKFMTNCTVTGAPNPRPDFLRSVWEDPLSPRRKPKLSGRDAILPCGALILACLPHFHGFGEKLPSPEKLQART